MSRAQRFIDSAWKLAWALLVCAVLLSFLRQRTVGARPAIAGGHPAGAPHDSIDVALVRLCLLLFGIGLLVRVKGWISARTAEAVRKRRLEAVHTLVGAPESLGKWRPSRPARPLPGRRH